MKSSQIPPLSDLPKFSKENWLKSIEKSLKNKEIESLSLDKDGLQIDPFPSYSGHHTQPLLKNQEEWIIGVDCQAESSYALNEEILYYLENGAEAIRISAKSEMPLQDIFEGVHTDFIYLDLPNQKIDPNFHLKKGAIDQNTNPSNGNMHLLTIKSAKSDLLDELTSICNQLVTVLKNDQIQPGNIRISTFIDSYIPVSIAKLRAIRLLWLNILQAYELELLPVFLCVNGYSGHSDQNQALIELSTIGVNAVLGGCDLLYLDGADFDANARRLAINIQHMLKMESKLHIYSDPLAGAFSIEHITDQICEKVWPNILLD